MKKILFASMMLAAFITEGTFTSCSNDDDDSEVTSGGGAPTADGKKLQFVKVGSSTALFEYDNEGRVLKVTSNGMNILFNYSETQVTSTTTYSGQSSSSAVTYMLTDGRVTKSIEKASSSSNSDYITNYTYDGDGCLTTINYSNSNTNSDSSYKTTRNSTSKTTYTWKDGNVASISEEDNYSSTTTYTEREWDYYTQQYVDKTYTITSSKSSKSETIYTYSDHTFTMPALEADAEEVLRWQGFFGKNSRNLPSKTQTTVTSTYSENDSRSQEKSNPRVSTESETIDYSYTFNGDALEKIFRTRTDDNSNVKVETIEMSWN